MAFSAVPVTDAGELSVTPMIVRRLDQSVAIRNRFDQVNDPVVEVERYSACRHSYA